MPKLGSWEESKAAALAEAKAIAENMKDEKVKASCCKWSSS